MVVKQCTTLNRWIPPLFSNEIQNIIEKTVVDGESQSLFVSSNAYAPLSSSIHAAIQPLKNFYICHLYGPVHMNATMVLKELLYACQLSAPEHTHVFAESVRWITEQLQQPFIIILHHFEDFALKKSQSVLYSLFEAVHYSKIPLAVIGLVQRVDALELLEKRVKSRFSQLQLSLNLPVTFEEFNKALETHHDGPLISKEERKRSWQVSNDITHVLADIHVRQYMPGYKKQSLDPKVALGKDLSLLELCLLLAIKHLETQLGEECYNFEMVYEEYLKFYRRTEANGSRGLLFNKKVAYRAFDTLKRLEFILPSTSETISNQCPKEYKLYRSTLVPFQIEQVVQARQDLPSTLKVWGSH